MREEVRTRYVGATPGADSNTYVIFSTVTAAPMAGWLQAASLRYAIINFKHSQIFTLNAYKSKDRGITWLQVSTEAITVTANATTEISWNVEAYADFKIEVVNGGSAQSTWAADISFYRNIKRRESGYVATTIADIQALLPYSLIDSETYTVDGGTGKVASFVDRVKAGTGIRASSPNHAYVQATGGLQSAIPTSDPLFGNKPSAKLAALGGQYLSQGTVANWLFCHAGTGMTVMSLYCSTDTSLSGSIMRTRNGAGTAGFYMGHNGLFTPYQAAVHNASANILLLQGGVSSNTEVEKACFSYIEGSSPEGVFRQGTTTRASGDTTAAPVTTASTATVMIIGNNATGTGSLRASWVFCAAWNRVITAAERALVYKYWLDYYGVA